MSEDSAKIRAQLEPMLAKAERDGLWLAARADLCFSPTELRAHQAKGSFVWGPISWQLTDPADLLDQLVEKVAQAEFKAVKFAKRMGAKCRTQRERLDYLASYAGERYLANSVNGYYVCENDFTDEEEPALLPQALTDCFTTPEEAVDAAITLKEVEDNE